MWYGDTKMELIHAHRDRGTSRGVGGDVGSSELLEEFDKAEEVDEVGDADPDDMDTSDSCAR